MTPVEMCLALRLLCDPDGHVIPDQPVVIIVQPPQTVQAEPKPLEDYVHQISIKLDVCTSFATQDYYDIPWYDRIWMYKVDFIKNSTLRCAEHDKIESEFIATMTNLCKGSQVQAYHEQDDYNSYPELHHIISQNDALICDNYYNQEERKRKEDEFAKMSWWERLWN
jgi:hypothetical protein